MLASRPGFEPVPAQTLDDVAQIDVAPLDVDAMPSAEAHDELLRAIAESKEGDLERADEAQPKETGKLYGVRTPHAADADLADGPDDGEHWLESLSQHATEGGAVPDDELVIIDETDDHGGAPPTERRDRPVADKGSGGAGGL